MLRFLALVSAFILSNSLFAQENVYQFSHLDIANGLPDNQVNTIFKDHKGFMWFGTLSGLNRYDGHEFKVFKHNSKDSSSLTNGYVTDIFEGPEKELWITSGGGFSIYSPSTEKFVQFGDKDFKKYKLPKGYLRGVKTNSSGKLYFQVDNLGVFCYNPKTNATIRYLHQQGVSNSLYADEISDFIDDEKGNLWVIYTSGILDKFNLRYGRVTNRYFTVNKRFGRQVNSFNLNHDSEGNIFIYSRGNPFGLYYLNAASDQFSYFWKKQDHSGLSSNNVSKVIEGNDGKIWIGTDHGGINILDKHTHRLTYILSKEDDPKGLIDNSVAALYKDNNGIVWVGTFKIGRAHV